MFIQSIDQINKNGHIECKNDDIGTVRATRWKSPKNEDLQDVQELDPEQIKQIC